MSETTIRTCSTHGCSLVQHIEAGFSGWYCPMCRQAADARPLSEFRGVLADFIPADAEGERRLLQQVLNDKLDEIDALTARLTGLETALREIRDCQNYGQNIVDEMKDIARAALASEGQ